MTETCQHTSCTDSAETTVHLEDDTTWPLCEDHAHMNPDGTPVDGYEPDEPEKFSD